MKNILPVILLFFYAPHIISQEITWDFSRQFGGTGSDIGYSITLDSEDNIIVGGTFQGIVD